MSDTFWTHPSIRAIAKKSDPVEAVLQLAQDATLDALEKGWTGPPFDAFELAKIRGLQVVPREDVGEARLTRGPMGRVEIHYNPVRPKSRAKFSIAHEIAHSLFPDCAEAVRHRGFRIPERDDEWQLEILCNLAAGELLMPIGSFPDFDIKNLTIDHLLKLRRDYEVSTEAILLRILRFAGTDFYVFSASTLDGETYKFDYLLDYTGPKKQFYGKRLRKESLLKNCCAIGFTEKGKDEWPEGIGSVSVECCAISPYPDQSYPRIVGFAGKSSTTQHPLFKPKEVVGDALSPRGEGPNILIHLVNDQSASWGAGFAKSVSAKFPKAEKAYRARVISKGRFQLGQIFGTRVSENLEVVQLIAQHGFGAPDRVRVRYIALRECFKLVAKLALEQKAQVHMPRIGTGLGGGDWMFVRELVEQEFCRKAIPVTVYRFGNETKMTAKQPSLFDRVEK